jgi:uncharacterized membrane protein YkvA (DUF1232 family)
MSAAIDPKFLEIFPAWLGRLGTDAAALGALIASEGPDEPKRHAVASLNYLFKSLDLIPDGVEDLGYLDDAFVLRVAASHAVAETPEAREGVLGALTDDNAAVAEFLGDDYSRLDRYVRALGGGAARGRTVDEILSGPLSRGAFLSEVNAWSEQYVAPSFTREMKTLLKLRAFLHARLP